jgi:23S rRNA pseudouridine1911/1915/1917 synthase
MSYKFTVEANGLKLASFLKNAFQDKFSAKLIKKTIEKGCCRVNKRVIDYSNHQLKKGDEIDIVIKEPLIAVAPEVLYEDPGFIIIFKPPGLVSEEKSLKNFFNHPLYLVHRLDKETSGLLIVAKTPEMKGELDRLFKNRLILKRYIALVDGHILQNSGIIEVPLEEVKKDHHAIKVMASKASGVMAKTEWKKLGLGLQSTFMEFDIITGKTHQIRAHAAHIGHAVLGDPIYLKKPSCTYLPEGLCLHAYYLKFSHPLTQKIIEIYAKPPIHFIKALKHLVTNAKMPRY